MAVIANIAGQKILDSRGTPTLEVTVWLDQGASVFASVPSGAFAGKYEAKPVEVDRAIENIANIIAPQLNGKDPTNQGALDQNLIGLDNSQDKSNLGGNTILGVSLALAKAGALARNVPLYRHINDLFSPGQPSSKLPIPMFNIINGGAHADNGLPFQEFLIIPSGDDLSFAQRMQIGQEIFLKLKEKLKILGKSTATGDEGGFAPILNSDEEAIELMITSIQDAGYQPRSQVQIGIDIAAGGIADLNNLTYPYQPLDYYRKLVTDYPVEMLEDPFGDDDWVNWQELVKILSTRIFVVGDDLFSTNMGRLKQGIEQKAANSISIKPNQIGTLTETFSTIRLAQQANMSYQISHRSGETEDTFISDLAVGTSAKYIKAGAPNRGERVAKYNQLLRIERELAY